MILCYNSRMRPIATDISNFEELRNAGQIYVDKTAYFHRMITDPSRRYFFCARPRRFGKSLGVTTLKSIFLGHREYFKDLAIAKTDYDFAPHTVVHFNWGGVKATSRESFDESFPVAVRSALVEAGYDYDDGLLPSDNMGDALQFFRDRDGKGCVILIDEYDDPVAKSLADVSLAEYIRDELASIYAQFKDNTDKIRFLFITGVSKFTKLSIFSTLSSLNDISFDDDYAAMFGYAEDELDANFDGHLRAHAEKMKLSYADYRAELKRWYNGYRFAKYDETTVYNPVSIAQTLVRREPVFGAYWSSTGRASHLMNLIKREGVLGLDYDNLRSVSERMFDVSDLKAISPVGMLFQTGYLTIKGYSPYKQAYELRIPDEEVRQDLSALLAASCANRDMAWAQSLGIKLLDAEWEPFFDGLKSLYAAMAYGPTEGRKPESTYARCLAFLLASQGFRFRMEDVQADGRADIVAEHPCGVYIFELKVDASAAAALDQVTAKGYDVPHRAKGLPIYAVGLSFDSQTRQLADAQAVAL